MGRKSQVSQSKKETPTVASYLTASLDHLSYLIVQRNPDHSLVFSCSCLHAALTSPVLEPLLTLAVETQAPAAATRNIRLNPELFDLLKVFKCTWDILIKICYLDTESNNISKPGKRFNWIQPFECWINHLCQCIDVMELRGCPSN